MFFTNWERTRCQHEAIFGVTRHVILYQRQAVHIWRDRSRHWPLREFIAHHGNGIYPRLHNFFSSRRQRAITHVDIERRQWRQAGEIQSDGGIAQALAQYRIGRYRAATRSLPAITPQEIRMLAPIIQHTDIQNPRQTEIAIIDNNLGLQMRNELVHTVGAHIRDVNVCMGNIADKSKQEGT